MLCKKHRLNNCRTCAVNHADEVERRRSDDWDDFIVATAIAGAISDVGSYPQDFDASSDYGGGDFGGGGDSGSF